MSEGNRSRRDSLQCVLSVRTKSEKREKNILQLTRHNKHPRNNQVSSTQRLKTQTSLATPTEAAENGKHRKLGSRECVSVCARGGVKVKEKLKAPWNGSGLC